MSISMLIHLACFVAWAFLLIWPIVFLLVQWKDKYNLLEGSFNEESYNLYYKLYKPAIAIPAGKTYKEIFFENYNRSYGRRTFAFPLFIFASILAISVVSIDHCLVAFLNKDIEFQLLPPIAMSALLGAYTWTGYDQLKKIRVQDFTAHDVNLWSFRFLIAIPIGYSFSYLLKDPLGIPFAFFLGSFPLKTLQKISRKLARKHIEVEGGSGYDSSELQKLQGVDLKQCERMQDEGIENILQLAYCDPVDLAMRSTLDFLYIIDIKAQALLWIYLEDKLNSDLRLLGLRSAHEMYTINSLLESAESAHNKVGIENLKEIAKKLEVPSDSLRKTVYEISGDPHTIFLFKIWCQVCGEQ